MSYCRYTRDQKVFQKGHDILCPRKPGKCQVVNNVNAAIVGELRQVPMPNACAAVRRCWKVFGAKEKPHCDCFSV